MAERGAYHNASLGGGVQRLGALECGFVGDPEHRLGAPPALGPEHHRASPRGAGHRPRGRVSPLGLAGVVLAAHVDRQQPPVRRALDVRLEKRPEVGNLQPPQHLRLPLGAVKDASPGSDLLPHSSCLGAQALGLLQLCLHQLLHLLPEGLLVHVGEGLFQRWKEGHHAALHVAGRVGGGLQDETNVGHGAVHLVDHEHDVAELLDGPQLVEGGGLADVREQLGAAGAAHVACLALEGYQRDGVLVLRVGAHLRAQQRDPLGELDDAGVRHLARRDGPRAHAPHGSGHVLRVRSGILASDVPHHKHLGEQLGDKRSPVSVEVLGLDAGDRRLVLVHVPAPRLADHGGVVHRALVRLIVAHVGVLPRELLLAHREPVPLDLEALDVLQDLLEKDPEPVVVPMDHELHPGRGVAERVVEPRELGGVRQRAEVVVEQLDPKPR
mmetsp:Transcript_9130/g.21976  ORF Transcript_9130/g.21976 Transcript_9130/m.21976 type:complete len:440 (-) Transcript_9130:1727-3046(-)